MWEHGLNVSQKLLSTICVDVWGLRMFVFPCEVTRNDFYLTWGVPHPWGYPMFGPVMGYSRLGLEYPHPGKDMGPAEVLWDGNIGWRQGTPYLNRQTLVKT